MDEIDEWEAVVLRACQENNVQCLLRFQSYVLEAATPLLDTCQRLACKAGSADALRVLLTWNREKPEYSFEQQLLEVALRRDDRATALVMLEHYPMRLFPIPFNCIAANRLFASARVIQTYFPWRDFENDFKWDCLQLVCVGGTSSDICQMAELLRVPDVRDMLRARMGNILRLGCSLDTNTWCLRMANMKAEEVLNTPTKWMTSFQKSCAANNWEMTQWLLGFLKPGWALPSWDEILECVVQGPRPHPFVHWVLDEGAGHVDVQESFLVACGTPHTDVVQTLYKFDPSVLLTEEALWNACTQGTLGTVQWLWSMTSPAPSDAQVVRILAEMLEEDEDMDTLDAVRLPILQWLTTVSDAASEFCTHSGVGVCCRILRSVTKDQNPDGVVPTATLTWLLRLQHQTLDPTAYTALMHAVCKAAVKKEREPSEDERYYDIVSAIRRISPEAGPEGLVQRWEMLGRVQIARLFPPVLWGPRSRWSPLRRAWITAVVAGK